MLEAAAAPHPGAPLARRQLRERLSLARRRRAAADRPRRSELAWYAEESNRFGTNEFLEYCRVLDTEPYICVNMGSGSMDEAQAWVEYCNGTGNTHWANLRRAHGHPEPHRVRYWGLGNEMYGSWQIGHLSPEDYVKKARAFALVMKRTDPSIELVGCGHNGWSDWDEIVHRRARRAHRLVQHPPLHGQADHYATVFQSHQAERAIRICAALIERARYAQRLAHPIHIAFDEWNVWYRTRRHEDRVGGVEERYTLTDALAVATYLHGFIRHCRVVRMANLAQLVNAIAPIFTSPQGLFLQTIYHPLRLYAEHMGEVALDVHVDGPRHDLPQARGADASGASTTWPTSGRSRSSTPWRRRTRRAELTIGVVNRDRDRVTPRRRPGSARRPGSCARFRGQRPRRRRHELVRAPGAGRRAGAPADGHRPSLRLPFPAHSVTVLRVPLAT